jgi:hypothetical protein
LRNTNSIYGTELTAMSQHGSLHKVGLYFVMGSSDKSGYFEADFFVMTHTFLHATSKATDRF